MQAFTRVTGPAAPLLRANVDTDLIIRIDRLTGTPRAELGAHAFEALRFGPEGGEDAGFVLNQPAFRGPPILIAGPNFGCGSSREGAVWALMGLGLRAVVAPSFGDIFAGNCVQNGLLPVVLPAASVERLAAAAAGGDAVTVDLVQCVVRAPGGETFPFAIDPQRREALLEGLDDIARTSRLVAEIEAWQARDRAERPWVWSLDTAPGSAPSTPPQGEVGTG